jgi:hypothetical protein
METIFLICALVGGTVLVIQVGMSLLGMTGAGGDVDLGDPGDIGGVDIHHAAHGTSTHHHSALPGIVKIITFQTVIAFLAFFGAAGMATRTMGYSSPLSLGIAVASGLSAMIVIGYLLAGFRKLEASGSLQLQRAVGCQGRVYVRIPAEGAGEGKVTVTVQGRTVELKAKTNGPELPTGTSVVVHKLLDSNTVEVAALEHHSETAAQVSS